MAIARFPFRATIVGAEVTVTDVDLTPTGPLPLETSRLIDAYRRWAGASPLDTASVALTPPWVYPRYDWDSDPIVEAADPHDADEHRAAIRLLDAELAADLRCIDAWAHLGLTAFDLACLEMAQARTTWSVD